MTHEEMREWNRQRREKTARTRSARNRRSEFERGVGMHRVGGNRRTVEAHVNNDYR